MRPEGDATNEVMSLLDVAERLSITRTRADRAVVRALRRLEQDTGRRILIASGVGKGRRYLVLGRELEAALDGDRRDIDVIADKIAAAVQRIEDRVQSVSVRVEQVVRRVEGLEQRGQGRLPF